MPRQQTHPHSPARGAHTDHRSQDTVSDDRATLQEAADALNVDEPNVTAILAEAGIPLLRDGDTVSVAREALHIFAERRRAERREQLRALTRASIEAGLDDVDYSSFYRDPS